MTFRQLILFFLLLICVGTACRHEPPAPETAVATDRLIVGISTDGVYRLTLTELQAAGLQLTTLNSDQMQLTQGDTAVPYLLQEDALLFYGRAADSRYTNTRPYLLQIGPPGELITETAVTPAALAPAATLTHTLHLQENHLYEAQALDADHTDPWFWHKISQGQTVDIPVTLPAVADAPARLRLQLWGQTHSPDVPEDHDLDVLVNGQPIETIRWDGSTHHQAILSLPPGLLRQGENQITLDNEAPGAVLLDIMLLNWLELELPIPPTAVNDALTFQAAGDMAQNRFGFAVTLANFSDPPLILDVQNPDHPTRLSGDWADGMMTVNVAAGMQVTAVGPQGYRSPESMTLARQSNWYSPENQADLLIITTDTLAPALTPLVETRQAQGLTAAVIPVAEIYDDFGGGEASPTSIQQFVTYALTTWQDPQPRYLLLVGEATTDYRAHNTAVPVNHVPSLLVPVAYSGETVSDGRLGDVDGDGQPNLAVGRWPVDSVAEVESLVARTLAYEAGTAVATALFATDASEAGFAPMAERLWQGAGIPETAVTHLPGAMAAEVTAVWNQGAWLTTYIGHGSLALWGKENLFNLDAVNNLQTDQPAIVVQLTCLTGLFAQPGVESLAEVMLQHEQGPVLTVAATSLTLSNHQEPFAVALLQNLNDPTVQRMGDAFQQAKLSLDTSNNGLREVSDTFVLLGDPSALIVRPATDGNP